MSETSKKFLIVDDEEAIREILSMYLEELDYDTITACDGVEGLEMLKEHNPDVVVSDYTMPNMDGIEFLSKARHYGYNLPFIVLTGNGSKDVALKALQLGAFDFLEKPFDADHLISLFQTAMEKSKSIQAEPETDEPALEESGEAIEDAPSAKQITESASYIEQDIAAYLSKVTQFAEEFENQLTFCVGSIKSLPTCDKKEIELGYLFRSMRELQEGADALRLSGIARLAKNSTDIYMLFRAHPERMQPDTLLLLAKGLNSLLNQLKNLSDKGSIAYRALATEIEMRDVYKELRQENSTSEEEQSA